MIDFMINTSGLSGALAFAMSIFYSTQIVGIVSLAAPFARLVITVSLEYSECCSLQDR